MARSAFASGPITYIHHGILGSESPALTEVFGAVGVTMRYEPVHGFTGAEGMITSPGGGRIS